MMNTGRFCLGLALATIRLCVPLRGTAQTAAGTGAIMSRSADVGGVKLYYLTMGHGETLILLDGHTHPSRVWRTVIPLLAEKLRVIAPDLSGIGDSSIPVDGLNMEAAISIHTLAESLGVQKARIVGHDIGLMVAYAHAAQFPA